MNIKIIREHYGPDVTTGKLVIEGHKHRTIYTLEEPWKDNKPGVSCIPCGTYQCIPHGWEPDTKLRQKRCWEITKVPDRSAILIHAANTTLSIEGCVAVGLSTGKMGNLPAVFSSRDAMELLRGIIGQKPFTLTVVDL
jgi:hypothetical protein